MSTKNIKKVYTSTQKHWVGNAFHVLPMINYETMGTDLSPFLMLDYGAPRYFEPTDSQRGVGTHPHRGFETVTVVYDGELAHKDSSGSEGVIGKGDVQWMTAGGGVIHEEFQSKDFTKNGGVSEMAQLWINLPAKHKMTEPQYQDIRNNDIPEVKLDNDGGTVRVIAGDFRQNKGAAKTFSPVNVWDMRLKAGAKETCIVPDGDSLGIPVLSGEVKLNGSTVVHEGQVAVFEHKGTTFEIEAVTDAKVLILSGEPLNEPIVGYGPFVMNSREQINEAINDFNQGRFGKIQNATEGGYTRTD